MAKIESGASADLLTIDPTSKAARAALYDNDGLPLAYLSDDEPTNVYGVVSMGICDEAALPVKLDRLGGVSQSTITPLLVDSFEGTTRNAIRWLDTSTTMTATQTSAGGLLFNASTITTITTGYMIQSTRKFLKAQRVPIQFKARARINPFNNSVMEIGFGDAATFNGTNTTGAYWQVTTSGVVQPVLTFNSVDVTGTDIRSSISSSNFYTWDVFLDDDEAVFTCQETSTGLLVSKQKIKLSPTGVRLWSSSAVGAQIRLYNTGVAPATAPQLILSDVMVTALNIAGSKTQSDNMAYLSRTSWENPFTSVQTATWTNSAEPASATLSNTAAGYTTLGGKFQFAAPAGAATDFALFGYQVPVPSNLVVTGITIDAWNVGAAVATTPHLLTWAVGFGSTAVSLATATVTRVPIGCQSFPVAAAIGSVATRIDKQFRTPIVVPSGRFFHVILRIPVGTATASQIIAGMVNVEGYFE